MTETKAIFITGGGSGIGQATAKLFGERGWRVGLADIDMAGLERTRAMLSGPVETYRMDVRDRDGWGETLDAFTAASGGRLDVLFNNAGVPVGGPLAEAGWEEIDRVVAINLTGALNGAKIGHAYLKRTPGSCLLNTASASGIYGSAGLVPYSMTKFAVRAMTEGLDGEWAGDGIRVRSIMPAFIDTPLLSHAAGGTNHSIRDRVTAGGMEISPVEMVAEAAWSAVHGDRLHTLVGRTAHRMAFAARWLPGSLRKRMRRAQ